MKSSEETHPAVEQNCSVHKTPVQKPVRGGDNIHLQLRLVRKVDGFMSWGFFQNGFVKLSQPQSAELIFQTLQAHGQRAPAGRVGRNHGHSN